VDNGTRIDDSVVLPGVQIGRNVVLRNAVVDKRCVIADGMRIGVDRDADRKRFYVSPGGVTLVTPEQLGQNIHATR
jgi:glucose-1-phosphate adenylyltransferase